VRFRLLNASQSQMIAVRFDRHEAIVVGLDGHPAEVFAARDGRVFLAPGNRADVMIDMMLAPGTSLPIAIDTPDATTTPITLRYTSDPPVRANALPPAATLPANPLPQQIPFGKAVTYSDIANDIGRPTAQRAVGAAVGANPISFVVPCHRALGKNGALTGYHWGLTRKRAMLGWESAHA
jgi:O-6-methylguanine DNA methyltransferase